MCGIAGAMVFNQSDFLISKEYIERMRDTEFMKLRGPDGGATWISDDNKVSLAHRRLSIIDLSDSAGQPMANENSSVIVSFNGEIYNHQDIKNILIKTGKYHWKTSHSDTEVLLHAYEEWGIDCLKYFKGMFAIAIWDDKEGQLYLVRDRIGIKPLYYSIHHQRIVFSSDINAILEDTEQNRELNEEALSAYLTFLTVPSPHTMFKGIYKLKAGTYISVSKEGRVAENQYWDILSSPKSDNIKKDKSEDLNAELVARLKEAVELRKISDVPDGVFLSGGIDSSINAVLFSDDGKERIKTFTVRFGEGIKTYHNEDDEAEDMARQLHADHHTVSVTPKDVFDLMPWLIRMMGEPLADPISVAQYLVAKEARDNDVIVCQIGEGSDELFSGYPLWLKMHVLGVVSRLPVPIKLRKMAAKIYSLFCGKKSFQYDILYRYSKDFPIFWTTNLVFNQEEKKCVLKKGPGTAHEDIAWKTIEALYNDFINSPCEHSILNWMTYVDLKIRMSDLLLPKVDKMCMSASLEARVPFLDADFVSYIFGIPEKKKYNNKVTKPLLKDAVRGLIPDEIIDRKKRGFALPVLDWYHGEIRQKIEALVRDFALNSGFLNYDAVETILLEQSHLKIWTLYTLALWWKEYFTDS